MIKKRLIKKANNMKFFKWLRNSRENTESITVTLGEQHGGGDSYDGPSPWVHYGTKGIFSLTPCSTTFYPPIEEKEK